VRAPVPWSHRRDRYPPAQMRAARNRLVALALTAALGVAACGGGGGGGFSQDLRRDLIGSCSEGESEAFCVCWVDELEARFTQAEVLEIVVGGAEAPPEYAEAARACVDRLDG